MLTLSACGDDDGEEETVLQATATATNQPPTISGTPSRTVGEGEDYFFKAQASDPDGDPILFGINGKPGWANFDNTTGELTGRPGTGDRGMHRGIVIWVTDGQSTTELPEAEIEVLPAGAPANQVPVISGTAPAGIMAGTFYDFIPVASDADGDPLTFAIANQPAWASFDPQIGRLSGTPATADIGSYGNIVISVSDGIDSAALDPFVIVVNPPPSQNAPPQISGLPPSSVLAGDSYAFTPVASDIDGDPLSFSAINLPVWAGIDSGTGTITGVPGQIHAGTYTGISIVVSDGEAQAALPAFSIEVISPNSPPEISGTPDSSVIVDDFYGFIPQANDDDGDNLSFSVTGLPSWASFDNVSGAIAGTPTLGDEGTYNGIQITVSDGEADATLGPFSIEVLPIATGSATLNWMPPTQNTDGSALVDLAGYIVYWGTSPGSYSNSVTIANAGQTSYVVDNLLSGTTYYFVTTAFNSGGMESSFSNEASKAIP